MHQLRGADDLPAERDADALMSEAYAKHRNGRTEFPDQLDRDAGVFRAARSRRDYDVIRAHRFDLVERDLVVAPDDRRRSKLAKILREVEGERVVVIEQKKHVRVPPPPS